MSNLDVELIPAFNDNYIYLLRQAGSHDVGIVDAGNAAYKAARAKDLNAVVAVNDQLYAACVTCHQQYRPNYRTRLPEKQ